MASGRERLAALRKAGLTRPTTPEFLPAQASGEQYLGRPSISQETNYESSIPLPRSPLPPRSPAPPRSPSPNTPGPQIPDQHISDDELMSSILTDLDALHAEKEASQASNRDSSSTLQSRRSSLSLYSPAQEQLEDITTDLERSHNSDRDSVASVCTLVAEEIDPMAAFYSEIEALQNSIRTLNQHIVRISELHARALDHPASGTEEDNYTNELTALIETTAALGALMKRRIKVLEAKTDKGRPSDVQIRKSQTELIKTKFIETLQNYQETEQQYRTKYKQRMERQFRIVNPQASAEEVRAVVDNTQSGQIFTQALMSTNRHGESRAAFREVQARHEDIKRIEETLCELAKMFEDMSTLVEQQEETIAAIETKAAAVEKDTEVGLGYATVATDSARAARKKRWICFALGGVILLIFIIAIAASIKPNNPAPAPAKVEEHKEQEKPSESRREVDEAFAVRDVGRQSSFGLASQFIEPSVELLHDEAQEAATAHSEAHAHNVEDHADIAHEDDDNLHLTAYAQLMRQDYGYTSRLDSHYRSSWDREDEQDDGEDDEYPDWEDYLDYVNEVRGLEL